MKPAELVAIRLMLGLLQREMAEYLCCSLISYKRYESGARPIPPYIERSALHLEFMKNKALLGEFSEFLLTYYGSNQ